MEAFELVRYLSSCSGLALCLLCSVPAFAIDPITPTLTGAADIAARRTTLINQLWGASTLPTTLPTVTTDVHNPFPSYNVARVDQYVASMSNGQSNASNLYIAKSPNNGRLVILNPGHQDDCDWTTLASGYRIQPVLQALLAAGYSVYAMNQPPAALGSTTCGDSANHQMLFSTYGNTAMGYFLEPAVEAMNYWDANHSFSRYDITGLSGGGWTAVLLPALDTRIKISIPVGSTWPGIIWNSTFKCADGICGDNCLTTACTEINWTNFFAVAGFIDLYIMGSYGPNRRMFHILNYNDDCCWGNAQYIAIGAPAFFGVDFPTFMRNWIVAVKQKQAVAMPFNYDGMIDYIATQHQFSTNAQSAILSILASTGPGNAGGGRRLFHIW
jgi:hypothetical protein